jgi:dimethylhistidine N-methyltransferase
MKKMEGAPTLRGGDPADGSFLADVLEGLNKRQKEIPCKYFYDARGSELFEEITDLDEYYPTRTELAIMTEYAEEMAEALGEGCLLIEYGSGSSRKTRLLLDKLKDPAAYVPIEISREALTASAAELAKAYPSLEILPVWADYTSPIDLPTPSKPVTHRAVYFPGSTIGNFMPAEAKEFLSHVADVVGPGGGVLIGVDLKKDVATLEAAYDDQEGVTAAFNMNLLERINRELDGEFPLEGFRHRAVYNRERGRVELHLVSQSDQQVRIAGEEIAFKKGETIHTENSYKYDLEEFKALAAMAGFEFKRVWMDRRKLFSVQHLTVY